MFETEKHIINLALVTHCRNGINWDGEKCLSVFVVGGERINLYDEDRERFKQEFSAFLKATLPIQLQVA